MIIKEFEDFKGSFYESPMIPMEDIMERFDNPDLKVLPLVEQYSGVDNIEFNSTENNIILDYIGIAPKKYIEYEKGEEIEKIYNSKVEAKAIFGEDFVIISGSGKKYLVDFISNTLLTEMIPMFVSEINMIKVTDHFSDIMKIKIDKVKDEHIKKVAFDGRGHSVDDFANFEGYDVTEVNGVMNFNHNRLRNVTVKSNGSFVMKKTKDDPIYWEDVNKFYQNIYIR